MQVKSRATIASVRKILLLAALLLGSGCTPQLRDIQIDQYRSVRYLADHLFNTNILTRKDRLLVIRLGGPVLLEASELPAGSDLFFDDAFVTGLVSNGAIVLQKMDINPPQGPAIRQTLDVQLDAKVAPKLPIRPMFQAATGSFTEIGTLVKDESAKTREDLLDIKIDGDHFITRKVKDSLISFGITKLLIYRWVYHSGGGNSPYSDRYMPMQNRAFVRIVDVATGYIVWSDLLLGPRNEGR